jgi:histidinol phosphatase-like PHP family hydrolase
MEAYLANMLPRRNAFTRIGLEVEVDADGVLILRDEDRARTDLLVGALHFFGDDPARMTAGTFDAAFLRAHEALLAQGVDILAHPTRMYGSLGRAVPATVRTTLAELLAATGTAAEINFHVQPPDVPFLAECVSRSVKLAAGTDAHVPEEMADLHPHLALVRRLANGRTLREILAVPAGLR